MTDDVFTLAAAAADVIVEDLRHQCITDEIGIAAALLAAQQLTGRAEVNHPLRDQIAALVTQYLHSEAEA